MLITYNDYILEKEDGIFYVSNFYDIDERKVRIDEEFIEDLKVSKDIEMVAILLGIIQMIRYDTSKFDKKLLKSIIHHPSFAEKLRNKLAKKSITNVINEISDMKYHEIWTYIFE